MEKNGTPWNNYSKTSSVYITGETKHYAYPFTMNDPTDLQARFVVNAGKSNINFSMDNISVREVVTNLSASSEPVDQVELDCFPNPSSNTLYITCYLEQASTTTLQVYNISGQQVETIDFGIRGAGQNEFIYNTTGLSNGIYLIQMKTDTASKYKKIIISN